MTWISGSQTSVRLFYDPRRTHTHITHHITPQHTPHYTPHHTTPHHTTPYCTTPHHTAPRPTHHTPHITRCVGFVYRYKSHGIFCDISQKMHADTSGLRELLLSLSLTALLHMIIAATQGCVMSQEVIVSSPYPRVVRGILNEWSEKHIALCT